MKAYVEMLFEQMLAPEPVVWQDWKSAAQTMRDLKDKSREWGVPIVVTNQISVVLKEDSSE